MNLKNTMIQLLILISLVIGAILPAYAGKYDHLIIKQPAGIQTLEISNLIALADHQIRDEKLRDAAQTLQILLDRPYSEVQRELDTTITPEGPLRLVVAATRLTCLNEVYYSKNPSIADECERLLKMYANEISNQHSLVYIKLYRCLRILITI